MTRRTSARVAGLACLFYMAVGIANEVLMHRATGAEGTRDRGRGVADRQGRRQPAVPVSLYGAPIFLFELAMGLWLVSKGLRTSPPA